MNDQYAAAYKALMDKRNAEAAAAQMPTEQQYAQNNDQQQLGTLLNSLMKSQALMGSVAGKPSQDAGFDMASFANNDAAALKAQAGRGELVRKKANEDLQLGRDAQADLMNVDKFSLAQAQGNQDLKMGDQRFDFNAQMNPQKLQEAELANKFTASANPLKLQDMQQDLNYQSQANPLDLQAKKQKLEMLKMEMQQGGQNPSEVDKEIAKIQQAEKYKQTAEFYKTSDPVKAKVLMEKYNQAMSIGGGKPPTEGQSNAAAFATRADESMGQMEKLVAGGYNPAGITKAITTSGLFPNVLKSSENQQQDQAQRNFVNALLRRESGAAISDSEFKNAESQYFPAAGDKPEVLAQKKQNMKTAIAGLRASAGDAAMGNLESQRGNVGQSASAPAASRNQDSEALSWAKANPNDPRSAKILLKLGGG